MAERPIYIVPYKRFFGAFVPNWLLSRPDVPDAAKLAYGRLMQFAGRNGCAKFRVAQLAAELGAKERSTQNALRWLQEHHLVSEGVKGRNPNGSRFYFFLAHPWMGLTVAETQAAELDPGALDALKYPRPPADFYAPKVVQEGAPPGVQVSAPPGVQQVAPPRAGECTPVVRDSAPPDHIEDFRFSDRDLFRGRGGQIPPGPRARSERSAAATRQVDATRELMTKSSEDRRISDAHVERCQRALEALGAYEREALRKLAIAGANDVTAALWGRKSYQTSRTLAVAMFELMPGRADAAGADHEGKELTDG